MDGTVKTVPLAHLRPIDDSVTEPKRTDLLLNGGAEWWFDGDDDLPEGRWKVRSIVGNTYRCVRLSGGTPNCQNVEDFDIAYVIRCVTEAKEQERQRVPLGF